MSRSYTSSPSFLHGGSGTAFYFIGEGWTRCRAGGLYDNRQRGEGEIK
jgi:hypothetical protein